MKFVSRLLVACLMVLAGGALIWISVNRPVTLVVDGSSTSLTTPARTVAGVLQQAGVFLGPNDLLHPDLASVVPRNGVIRLQHARQVHIVVDGDFHTLQTTENRPANLLQAIGVELFPGDKLLTAGKPIPADLPLPPSPWVSLQVLRANPITLFDGDKFHTFNSTAATIGQALGEVGVQLYAADRIDPPLDTLLDGPVEVTLARSKELAIQVGGEMVYTRSAAETVGEALAEGGIALQGWDYSLPGQNEPIPPNGRIQVVRVTEALELEQAPVPFETQFQPVPNLEIDNQQLLQSGEYGLLVRRVRVRYENNQEISRQVEGEWMAAEPQSRMVGYGTKTVLRNLNSADGNVKYWRALDMYAVSYSPSSAGGDVTASGLPLEKGLVAIDRRYIPFGTRLYIPGYGFAVAADVGGGINGRMIDLGYSDDDYKRWSQWVKVYFLAPVPPAGQIVWIIP